MASKSVIWSYILILSKPIAKYCQEPGLKDEQARKGSSINHPEDFAFGRLIGFNKLKRLDSHREWVSLLNELKDSPISKYPAVHSLQAIRAAQVTEVYIAMELAIPSDNPMECLRESWETSKVEYEMEKMGAKDLVDR